jgi:PAS domain S-box-containing protein
MKSNLSNEPATHDHEHDTESTRIRAAQVRLLYQQGTLGLFAALFLAIITTASLWTVVSHFLLVVWLGCCTVVYIARFVLVLAFYKISPVGEDTIPWGIWSAIGNSVTGLLWGASAVLMIPTVSVAYQTILCFFYAGIAIGSVTIYFPRKEVYTPFVVAVGLPLAATLIHQGSSINITMGGLVLIYVIILLIAGNRMHSTLKMSLKLRFENQDLIQSLREEKVETELLNESLRTEIRERKKAQEELQKLASVVRYSGELVNLTTLDGRMIFLNDAGSRMLGIKTSEVERHVIAEVIPEILLELFNNELIPELIEGRTWEGELQYRNVNTGKLTDVQAMCFTIKDAETDVPLFFAHVSRDITERKRAEEALQKAHDELERRVDERTAQLQTKARDLANEVSERERIEDELREEKKFVESALDTLTDAFVVFDLEGKFLRWNKAVMEISGYSDDEMSTMNPADFFAGEDIQRVTKAISLAIEEGHSSLNASVLTKAGVRIPFEFYGDLVRDDEGMPSYVCVVGRDASERKRLEEQLRQAQKMEAVGTLAGGIAHDFNNLLQVVVGFSDLLLENKEEDDPDRDRLLMIRKAAQDGGDLVKGLLTFSRMVKIDPRPIDLNQEVKRVRDLLYRTIPKMIDIELILADDLKTVNVDTNHIEQVLLNLAVNARDAMPEGGRLIIETENATLSEEYCKAHLEVEPGEYVLLAVSDTGHGMEEELLEHIFEPFYTTKETVEGTGLGLAMVFGIVKSHHGHITCYSEPGTGTSFKIYLPAVKAETESEKAITVEIPSSGTETILLVEDDERVQKVAKKILVSAGYKILVAANGSEALEIYRKRGNEISLVILDLIMPEMGGQQCFNELLKIDPEIKVLIASGYSANGTIRGTVDSGAKGFISKPYDSKQILRKIRDILDHG